MINRLLFVFTFLGVFQTSQPLDAGEFGNIFGNEGVGAKSRVASAQALNAIELISRAMRFRESGQSAGIETLNNAVRELRGASAAMEELLESDFPDFTLSEQQFLLIENTIPTLFLNEAAIKEELSNFSDLFIIFILAGEALAITIENELDGSIEQLMLPKISETLEQYLALGRIVTELSRSF